MRVGKLQYSQDMFPQALETLKEVSVVKCYVLPQLSLALNQPCIPSPSPLTVPCAFAYSSPLFPLSVLFPQAAAECDDGSLLHRVSGTAFPQYQSMLIAV